MLDVGRGLGNRSGKERIHPSHSILIHIIVIFQLPIPVELLVVHESHFKSVGTPVASIWLYGIFDMEPVNLLLNSGMGRYRVGEIRRRRGLVLLVARGSFVPSGSNSSWATGSSSGNRNISQT
jgi:hypothetical protein